MSILWAVVIVIGTAATAVAVACSCSCGVARRTGSYFNDGDRAAGVFGVLATGFSVLLGFIVFLAFANYDVSRTRRRDRGDRRRAAVPDGGAASRRGDGRALGRADLLRAVGRRAGMAAAWRRVPRATRSTPGASCSSGRSRRSIPRRLRNSPPTTSGSSRPRRGRPRATTGSTVPKGVIPSPLWIVLFFIAVVILVFMLFFADSGERPQVQGLLIGSVVAVMVATLLVIKSLDMPFHDGLGSIQPVAMERTLEHRRAGACRDRPRRPCAVRRHGNPDELRRCPPFAPSRSSPPCCSPLRP